MAVGCDNLPLDILQLIMSHCDLDTLLESLHVSKTWNQCAKIAYWNSVQLDVTVEGPPGLTKASRRIKPQTLNTYKTLVNDKTIASYVRELKVVDDRRYDFSRNVSDPTVKYGQLLKSLPNLRTIKWHSPHPIPFAIIREHCPYVNSILLDWVGSNSLLSIFKAIRMFPHFEDLDLALVIRLTPGANHSFTTEQLAELVVPLVGISIVDLSFSRTRISPLLLPVIAKSVHRLRYMKASPAQTDEGAVMTFNSYPILEQISLRFLNFETTAVYHNTFKKVHGVGSITHINFLNFQVHTLLNDIDFEVMLPSISIYQNVRTLILGFQAPNPPPLKSVEWIADILPKLQVLNLSLAQPRTANIDTPEMNQLALDIGRLSNLYVLQIVFSLPNVLSLSPAPSNTANSSNRLGPVDVAVSLDEPSSGIPTTSQFAYGIGDDVYNSEAEAGSAQSPPRGARPKATDITAGDTPWNQETSEKWVRRLSEKLGKTSTGLKYLLVHSPTAGSLNASTGDTFLFRISRFPKEPEKVSEQVEEKTESKITESNAEQKQPAETEKELKEEQQVKDNETKGESEQLLDIKVENLHGDFTVLGDLRYDFWGAPVLGRPLFEVI